MLSRGLLVVLPIVFIHTEADMAEESAPSSISLGSQRSVGARTDCGGEHDAVGP